MSWEAIDEELIPVPDGLLCTICQDLFQDPVATVDGHSYCRDCITKWFDEYDRRFAERRRMGQHLDASGREVPFPLLAPMTNLSLPARSLRANVALRQAVDAYRQSRPVLEQRERERRELREAFGELQRRHEFLLSGDDKTRLVSELHRLRAQNLQLVEQVCAANTELLHARSRADQAEQKAKHWKQRAEALERICAENRQEQEAGAFYMRTSRSSPKQDMAIGLTYQPPPTTRAFPHATAELSEATNTPLDPAELTAPALFPPTAHAFSARAWED